MYFQSAPMDFPSGYLDEFPSGSRWISHRARPIFHSGVSRRICHLVHPDGFSIWCVRIDFPSRAHRCISHRILPDGFCIRCAPMYFPPGTPSWRIDNLSISHSLLPQPMRKQPSGADGFFIGTLKDFPWATDGLATVSR